MVSFGKFERTVDPVQARKQAFHFANRQNLKIESSSVGSILKTTSCKIVDSVGKHSEGRGKGIGDQSLASALFEAIEHYYYCNEDFSSINNYEPLDLIDKDRELSTSSPDLNLICSGNAIILNRLKFSQIDSPGNTLFYPAIFMNPNYRSTNIDEQQSIINLRLRRYSTNSGTASGINESEAILHGLLETIERDAIGIELLRTIIKPNGFPVREIKINSLPHKVKEIYQLACAETEGDLKLWDITTDTCIPTILCALTFGEPTKFCFFGSGSSLSAAYAIERAILESIQGFHIQNKYNVIFQRPMKQVFNKMSLYQRCNLEDGYFLFRWGKVEINFTDIKSIIPENEYIPIKSQIDIIIILLKNLNIKAYYRNIYDQEMYVSQVLVPKLERFYLVSHGIPVAPSSRGRTVLNGPI